MDLGWVVIIFVAVATAIVAQDHMTLNFTQEVFYLRDRYYATELLLGPSIESLIRRAGQEIHDQVDSILSTLYVTFFKSFSHPKELQKGIITALLFQRKR